MKVRTSLFLLSAILAILVVALGFMMLYTSDLTNREVRECDAASKIIKDIFELNIVTYEYLMHHEERMHQQWLLKYDSLGKLLEEMIKEEIHPEHLSRLESMTSDYESLGDFFSQLQANFSQRQRLIEDNKPQAEIDLSLVLENRLTAQALMRSQRITSEVFEWSAIRRQRIAWVQQRTNSIVLFSIIGFAILSFCISFLTTRAIIGPLNELVRSAEIIGKGNLKHRVDIKTRNEIGELAAAFNQMTERRQRAEEKIEHLNLVLRAIRGVNQLMVRERDRDRLLRGACDSLIETRGYHNAWIALLDEAGGLVTTAEAGVSRDSPLMVRQLKRGKLPSCAPKALAQSGVVVVKDPALSCADCPLSAKYVGRGGMSIRLEHGGKVYGLLVVSMPAQFIADEEEQTLFKEVAEDIAFALHNMEVEEERQRAEEALKEYSDRLEEMVEERTEELREAQDELVRKERLAVLGQLAGGVGHELRNPLGVISNAVYYLQTTLPDADETTKEYLAMISSEVRNSDKIVSDLLDLSRTKLAEREEVEVSDLVAQVLERQPPPEKVKVATEIAPDLPPLLVDPRQIGQVLVNLITNAYDAMPEGGRLSLSAEAKKENVYLSIRDTGCGISRENMERLFEPLFTTKARGIGLGLAVSKNLVEVNGGSIEVESEEGKGSTFTVVLPTKEAQT